MSGSVTVLDNTDNGATGFHGSSAVITSTAGRGYSFTTSASSSWEITGIRLAFMALSGSTTWSITIGLYESAGSLPAGSALASVSLSLAVFEMAYFSFDASALGAVATATMSAGTGYALAVFAQTTDPIVKWGLPAWDVTTMPTASGGFSIDSAFMSNDGGSSWSTHAIAPLLQLQVQATCFLRGTLILTSRGEVPVERLRAGELVATKFGGLRPVRWIGTQRFEGRLAGAGHQPIRFATGSLGDGMPSCELRVSPGHAMLVNEVLAHAGALVNGSTITQERVRGVIEYFHIDLGPHDCVLANGAWAESYFEDRNRHSFHNAAEFHALFPGHVPVRQATCLPIVTAEHPGIGGLRAKLAPVRMAA